MTAMQQQAIDLRFWSKAKREADERGVSDLRDIERLMELIRFREYRRAIEPYLRKRTKLMSDWLSLQVRMDAPQPQWLTDAVALWDEMISTEAKKFGYNL